MSSSQTPKYFPVIGWVKGVPYKIADSDLLFLSLDQVRFMSAMAFWDERFDGESDFQIRIGDLSYVSIEPVSLKVAKGLGALGLINIHKSANTGKEATYFFTLTNEGREWNDKADHRFPEPKWAENEREEISDGYPKRSASGIPFVTQNRPNLDLLATPFRVVHMLFFVDSGYIVPNVSPNTQWMQAGVVDLLFEYGLIARHPNRKEFYYITPAGKAWLENLGDETITEATAFYNHL